MQVKVQFILLLLSLTVNSTVSCHHNWSPLPDTDSGQSVCTVCNLCCDKGENCVYNRVMGTDLRQCGCRTATPGCVDCGICVTCAKNLWVSSPN